MSGCRIVPRPRIDMTRREWKALHRYCRITQALLNMHKGAIDAESTRAFIDMTLYGFSEMHGIRL